MWLDILGISFSIKRLVLHILTINICTEKEVGLWFRDSYIRISLKSRLDALLTHQNGRPSVLTKTCLIVQSGPSSQPGCETLTEWIDSCVNACLESSAMASEKLHSHYDGSTGEVWLQHAVSFSLVSTLSFTSSFLFPPELNCCDQFYSSHPRKVGSRHQGSEGKKQQEGCAPKS